MQLTINHEGLADMILSEAVITSETGESMTVTAQWDTGATNSMITEDVAQKLNLKTAGSICFNHAAGASEAILYRAAVEIKGKDGLDMGFVRLPAMPNVYDIGMLIGMDIIKHGKLSIENVNGNTVFTFTH